MESIDRIELGASILSLLRSISSIPPGARAARVVSCLGHAGDLCGEASCRAAIVSPKSDGGWEDVESSAWSLAALRIVSCGTNDVAAVSRAGIRWLDSERTPQGAWGRTARDLPRIPVTAWVITLLPELADSRAVEWLEVEWSKDLKAKTRLTYKGALTLKAFASVAVNPKDPSLIDRTMAYLVSEQNEDGGYSPWKGHPVGSEAWSTGIALIGLTSWPDRLPPDTIKKAVHWLARTQLPNGLWPCHYIEEGSAYSYWGAVEAMKVLKLRGV